MNQTTNIFSQLANQYLKGEVEQETVTDPDILKIIHGLNKKSEVTKLKTLAELKVLLPTKGPEYYDEFTPCFVNIYKRYVDSEYERRILEQCNQVLALICTHGKKSLQKKFKLLFPQWFMLMNDHNPEVSQSAMQAFLIAFPQEKHGQAIQICTDAYLNDLKHYLTLSQSTVKQEANVDDDKAESIFERLKVAAIKSVATAIQWNPLPGFAQQLADQINIPILIQQLNTKKTRIVAAIIDTFDTLLQNEHTKPFIIQKSEQLLQHAIRLFEDKDRQVQNSLWKGFIFRLFSNAPQELIAKQTQLEVKSLELISKAGYGVGKIMYNNLILFISNSPVYSCNKIEKEELFRQRLTSCKKLLDSVLEGLQHEEARFFSEQLINCYFELLYFLTCKRLIINIDKFNNVTNQVKNFVVQSLKTVIQAALSYQQNTGGYNHNPYKQVPSSVGQFFSMITIEHETINMILNEVFEELKKLKVSDYNVFIQIVSNLQKVPIESKAQPMIQKYISYLFDEVYNNNNIEQGSQLFEILQPTESLKRENVEQNIRQLLMGLFQKAQVIEPIEALNICYQTKKYVNMLQRIQNINIVDQILLEMLNKEFKVVLSKEDKIKWVCFFMLSDINVTPNYCILFYSLKDTAQEYTLIAKHLPKQLNQPISMFSQQLITKTIAITNISYKIFIPYFIANNEQIMAGMLIKQQEIADKLKVHFDRAYLGAFEEISYILSHTSQHETIFTVLFHLYITGYSQKAQFLIKLVNPKYNEIFITFFGKIVNSITNETITKFIHYLGDCLELIKINSTQLLEVVQFNLQSAVPWNIFQILDCPNDYFVKQFKEGKLELIAMFLAANYSSIMLHDHKLKRYLQNFVSNYVKPIILDSFEANNEASLDLVKLLFNQKDLAYGVALKQLVRQIYLEFGSTESQLLEKLTQIIMSELQSALISKNISKQITIRSILPQVKLNQQIPLDEFINSKNLQYLDIITIILQQSETLIDLESEEKLEQLIHSLFTIDLQTNYEIMVAFDFINLICERKTITPFAAYVKEIFNLFKFVFKLNHTPQKYYSFGIVTALQFLRKVLNFLEAFPIEFIDYLNFQLTDTLLTIIAFCNEIKPEFMDEQNDTLFVEYAETLLRVVQHESWLNFDSTTFYRLLQSPFVAIQKAAFLAIKQRQADDVDEALLSSILSGIDLKQEEINRLRQDEEDIEDVITFPLESKLQTHLLAWLTVMQRKVSFKVHYPVYLNNLLYLLNFLNENGVVARFTHKEIYQCDIELMVIQDDQSELLKLVVISFYQFIIAQQSYFKQWFNQECNVSQRKQVEDLLVYISKAIYLREVDLIELNQAEWRCEGFEIMAVKNQQEITAIYQKEEQKIEVVILVPQGYPLKALKIEAKKGVKLGEDKLKKWSLMIRMLLQNNNDTILSALQIWKKNIDQQFEGLEECAICYYIIHQNGELPKMGCRTCKHKFHSTCIQKWFQSSNKSDCPLCKSQFL